MNTRQLHEEIDDLFQEEMGLKVPDFQTDLMETGYMDSLRFTHLLAALEEKYRMVISIEDLEIENFKSIENIAMYIFKFKSKKQSSSHAL